MCTLNTGKDFSELLVKHRDIKIHDTFHQVLAMLLYPLHDKCGQNCNCAEKRQKVVFSLNVELFNRLKPTLTDKTELYITKLLLQIPEDHDFIQNWNKSFPAWLVYEQLKKQEIRFKRVEHLVWGLLRLAKTNQQHAGNNESSIKEAVRLLFEELQHSDTPKPFGGKKAYDRAFRVFKRLSHLIAGVSFLNPETSPLATESDLYSKTPEQINSFFARADWIKQRIESMKTPNVEGQSLFFKAPLVSLPKWVDSKNIEIPLEPFQTRVDEIKNEISQAEIRQCSH